MFKKTAAKITRYEYNNGEATYFIDVIKNDSLNGHPCFSATLTKQGCGFTTHLDGIGIVAGADINEQYREYLKSLFFFIDEDIAYYEIDMERDEEHFWEDYYADKEREEN